MDNAHVESMLVYQESDLFINGSGPISMDVSSIGETYRQISPTEGPETGGVGESNYYNGRELHFSTAPGDRCRFALDRSYIRIEGHAATYIPGVGEAGVPATTSIPWNSYAALLNQVRVKFNDNTADTEEVTQEYGHGSMAKILTTYSRDALESMHDSLFTPCLETVRDTTLTLSPESAARSILQLQGATGGSIQYHAKNLYLCDIFDSLRMPSLMRYRRIDFTFLFNAKDKILFSSIDTDHPNYYVTDVKLYLCVYRMSEPQLKLEAGRTVNGRGNYRISYWNFDAEKVSYSGPFTQRESNVRNMQAAILMFPSNYAPDHLGVNPYQYCYASGLGGLTGVTSYEFTYDNIKSPDSQIVISQNRKTLNTCLYANYRAICKKIVDREFPIAVPYTAMAHINTGGPDDISPYVMFCAQIYPPVDRIHRNLSGCEFEATVATSTPGTVIIVKIRASLFEALSDYSITVIK